MASRQATCACSRVILSERSRLWQCASRSVLPTGEVAAATRKRFGARAREPRHLGRPARRYRRFEGRRCAELAVQPRPARDHWFLDSGLSCKQARSVRSAGRSDLILCLDEARNCGEHELQPECVWWVTAVASIRRRC